MSYVFLHGPHASLTPLVSSSTLPRKRDRRDATVARGPAHKDQFNPKDLSCAKYSAVDRAAAPEQPRAQ